jgi:hypothetical protein
MDCEGIMESREKSYGLMGYGSFWVFLEHIGFTSNGLAPERYFYA